METLVKWSALEGQPQEILGKWKSLIQGNPSYREIIYTRGTPRTYKGESLAKGNELYKEASFIVIYGNSCKVNALFNKGAHPRPSLFEESSVHLKTSGNHRENHRNQSNQRGQGKNYQKPSRKPQNKQNKQNFQTHVGQSGLGSESCSLLLLFGFLDGFLYFLPWPLWLCWFLWLSRWFLMFSNFCIVCLSVCLETIK